MTTEQKKPRPLFWVFFVLFSLLFLVLLELNKNTVLGWILAILLLGAYAVFYARTLSKKSGFVRVAGFLGLMLLLMGLLFYLTVGPVKRRPAVEGPNGGVTDIITVADGQLTGVLTADKAVEVYAGIPYAAPPVGDLRWREPQDPEPWDGVLKADTFAPMSMQPRNSAIYNSLSQIVGFHDYEVSLDDHFREANSEDSLYLNIWKPAGPQQDLPVLVFIHGGALQTGQPWYADYRGEGLARKGVLAVNMGYRLGVFGFLATDELAAESPNGTTGNYGLLDQIKALEWVQANIAAFGGDPDNVTIAGESAGSACVSALCTSPLARGLFRRAIGESSTVSAPLPAHSFRLLDEAKKTGDETLRRFHAANIDELRRVDAESLAAAADVNHHITVDGYVLTETPYESYCRGVHNEEACLQGFNALEASPFILFEQANRKNSSRRSAACSANTPTRCWRSIPSRRIRRLKIPGPTSTASFISPTAISAGPARHWKTPSRPMNTSSRRTTDVSAPGTAGKRSTATTTSRRTLICTTRVTASWPDSFPITSSTSSAPAIPTAAICPSGSRAGPAPSSWSSAA